MLKKLLVEIASSHIFSKQKLAMKLDTSEHMVDEGLNRLVEMGYIKNSSIGGNCNFKCTGCAVKNCNMNINTLVVTEKGEKLLNKF